MLIFCEIWKTEVIDHIPGPHQHTQPILLQQLEIVTMGSIPHELGQLVVHVVRLTYDTVTFLTEEIKAEHAAAAEQADRQHRPVQHAHINHTIAGPKPCLIQSRSAEPPDSHVLPCQLPDHYCLHSRRSDAAGGTAARTAVIPPKQDWTPICSGGECMYIIPSSHSAPPLDHKKKLLNRQSCPEKNLAQRARAREGTTKMMSD